MAHDPHGGLIDRELLLFILVKVDTMAIDLSALNAAVTKLGNDVTALINADASALNAAAAQLAVDQAAVNAVVPSITALSTAAEAALTTPKPVTAVTA